MQKQGCEKQQSDEQKIYWKAQPAREGKPSGPRRKEHIAREAQFPQHGCKGNEIGGEGTGVCIDLRFYEPSERPRALHAIWIAKQEMVLTAPNVRCEVPADEGYQNLLGRSVTGYNI